MGRRKTYSNVRKINQFRPDHVKGEGQTVFRGFQCLNPDCRRFIFIAETEIAGGIFAIDCESCGFTIETGEESPFFDYILEVDGEAQSTGTFAIKHEDYVLESGRYKYCLNCCALKPLDAFSKHAVSSTGGFASGHQGECRSCKTQYNAIKNGTRLGEQHREAADLRRLYGIFAPDKKVEERKLFEIFDSRCFKCSRALLQKERDTWNIDHTLPAALLWPLDEHNATLLCSPCNGNKRERWPKGFYEPEQLRRLSIRTGIPYENLTSTPFYNPTALRELAAPGVMDRLLDRNARYIDAIVHLRNKILDRAGVDIFKYATKLSAAIITKADEKRVRRVAREGSAEHPN